MPLIVWTTRRPYQAVHCTCLPVRSVACHHNRRTVDDTSGTWAGYRGSDDLSWPEENIACSREGQCSSSCSSDRFHKLHKCYLWNSGSRNLLFLAVLKVQTSVGLYKDHGLSVSLRKIRLMLHLIHLATLGSRWTIIHTYSIILCLQLRPP